MSEFNNEELDRVIEDGIGRNYSYGYVKAMAQDLIDERKKPDVWKSADKCVNRAIVNYVSSDGRDYGAIEFRRELPKSPEREIAEKWANTPTTEPTRKYLADTIEAAINEYKESVK